MSYGDAPGAVTICSGRRGLSADDFGVTVGGMRARRITWPEVSRFEDGSVPDRNGYYWWVLLIVLCTGEQVSACQRRSPPPEWLTAIRQLAERHGIPADVTGIPMKDGRAADPLETVRIDGGLRADRLALTVTGEHRFEWAEISRFAEESVRTDNGVYWNLLIVLRSGRTVAVRRTPTPEMLAVLRDVAARHQIPADLTGVPAENGRPLIRGLYQDPGGRAGLRYWDGTQWSPLLPPDVVGSRTVRPSAASWSELPMAGGYWTYAAAQTKRATARFAIFATITPAVMATGLIVELWWDRGAHHNHLSGKWWFFAALLVGALASRAWRDRRLFRKLDEAAKGTLGGWS